MSTPSGSIYRDCRRAFIAAAEGAHVDTIARLHPSKDKDGKPLFMDSAALGPRLATRAVLVIASDAVASAIMVAQLESPGALPADARLVLVHALDPARFAGVPDAPAWPAAMLTAVAREDLSKVRDLAVLPLTADPGSLGPPLAAALPKASIQILAPAVDLPEAKTAIAAFFGH